MRSRWITHKGVRILYCDYTHFGSSDFESLKAELDAVVRLIEREPANSVLSISDIRDSVATREVVTSFKEAAVAVSAHVRKQAVVGVTGLKKIIFDAVVRLSGRPTRAFGDLELEEAKDWLVADAD